MSFFLVVLMAYLLGSIPFGYILVKVFLKRDIRETGSGNIGATNVARSGAKGLAIATLLLDAAKGIVAVFVVSRPMFGFRNYAIERIGALERDQVWFTACALAALAAIIGHMFPVWLRFKGGKGVATGIGAFAALAPLSISVVFLLFIVVVAATRFVSLGSILAAAFFPIVAHYLNGYTGVPLLLMSTASLFIILKHHENIRRLIAGTENKFGGKKSVPPPEAMEKQA